MSSFIFNRPSAPTTARFRHIAVAALMAGALSLSAGAETLRWNVQKQYGITADGIRKAIQAAKEHFSKEPNDTIVLEFDEGTYKVEGKDTDDGSIDLSGVNPGPDGRLVFKGAGMEKTVLVFNNDIHAIFGRKVFHVTMADMHMTREKYTVSQGLVVEAAAGKVVLDIQEGFPTPADIFNPTSDQGRFIRRYTNSKEDPQLVVKDNVQLAWREAKPLGDRLWQLDLVKKNLVPNYQKGELIGIKSKHGGKGHGGQAYWLMEGSDFIFQSVKWTQKTRGVFRGGFDKIQILDCVTDRAAPIAGQTPCLASPDGGPQIGQPWDPPTKGNIVKNCRFIASGDDAVAFFHGTGEVSGCQIRDAFARGILLSDSPDVVVKDNTLIRCGVQNTKDYKLPGDPADLVK
ncbi:right-handed parallel beta-helix repeat-containing protein [Luteolibacter ambystomatis]|uniref:Right-handed parallel beta-helix repeat-containing protein n=1 Tax=Luteolibacter ambystomatis TaxID=2824561 RepID=A0A975PEV0_9BACT|nr:right-handed parallel beta-helix repeat-containing protein [Luteolibacter ambystomatis]QUE51668.1 right-handed parallel beta-helix repeat-containing protein [Luteolibacter ambystomatis]